MEVLEGKVTEIVEDGLRYPLIKIGEKSITGVYFKGSALKQFVNKGEYCKLYAIDGPPGTVWPVAVETKDGSKYYSSVVNLFGAIAYMALAIFALVLGISSGGYWWIFGAVFFGQSLLFQWLPYFRYMSVPKSGFVKI